MCSIEYPRRRECVLSIAIKCTEQRHIGLLNRRVRQLRTITTLNRLRGNPWCKRNILFICLFIYSHHGGNRYTKYRCATNCYKTKRPEEPVSGRQTHTIDVTDGRVDTPQIDKNMTRAQFIVWVLAKIICCDPIRPFFHKSIILAKKNNLTEQTSFFPPVPCQTWVPGDESSPVAAISGGLLLKNWL